MMTNVLNILKKEGSALVNFPKEVFYNPVQEFNRDLTISIINVFNKYRLANKPKVKNSDSNSKLRIFEALSATGLRSIRFAKEVCDVERIIANDIDPVAAKLIKENVILNNVEHIVETNCGDAIQYMYEASTKQKKFHVVDLDPYGSAAPFLDSAVQVLTNGGLLCVTCTDAPVLCGAVLGTATGRYGSTALPSKMPASHEQGIRIILHAIQSTASRYGRYIQPLLSLSIDFYFRVFVRIYESPAVVKAISTKTGMIFWCTGCNILHNQPLGVEVVNKGNKLVHASHGPLIGPRCEECGGRFMIGGPLWIDPIHDQEFCTAVLNEVQNQGSNTVSMETPLESARTPLATSKRIIGMISLAKEELHDIPFYYEPDQMASKLRSTTPPMLELHSALLNAGFRVSSSHCHPNSLKTDATPRVIWDVFRSYLRVSQPEKLEKLLANETTDSHSRTILSRPDTIVVNFDIHKDANPISRSLKLLRFQANPLPNWGPKSKATKFQKD